MAIKVPRGSLKWQMNFVINKQFEKGIGKDRHAYKEKNGHADYERIYSKSSHKTHVGRTQRFANWLRKEDIKHINQVTPSVIETFLSSLAGQKYTHKYIQGYQSTINHILHGNEVKGHPIYSVHKLGIQGKTERVNNKFDKDRPTPPSKYDEQFDLIKASGFRREELENVGTKSMYEAKGEYFLVTNGKGGRPRYTQIRKDYKEKFAKRYADNIIKVDRVSDIPQRKDEIQEVYKTQKLLFERTIPSKYATHIYRAEYAQKMLKEVLSENRYKAKGYEMDINGFVADREAFRKVSYELGHNRATIELLSSYFRKFKK